MASYGGDYQVIGSRDVAKQEKNIHDSRTSITAYQAGLVSGNQGPTGILCVGKKKKRGYPDTFLQTYGVAISSTIIMTETAFMTEDSWRKMSPKMMEWYRAMEYIKDNPQ